jgi:hypothetical protein
MISGRSSSLSTAIDSISMAQIFLLSARLAQLESPDDRTWPLAAAGAISSELRESVACLLQFRNFSIERHDPRLRHNARFLPVIGCIQGEQISNLVQSKSSCLRLPDEAKPAQVIGIIATDAAAAIRLGKQSPTLIEAYGFNAYAARYRKFSNRHCIQGLTPYYATEPI